MRAFIRMLAANKFFEGLLAYNLILLLSVVLVYHTIDFEAHFQLPEGVKPTTDVMLYYAFLSQSNVMAGEIVPKTRLGRTLLAVHIFLSWGIILAFLVPWPADAINSKA